MKKLLSFTLCLVLIVASCFLLAGCNSGVATVSLYDDNLVADVTREKGTNNVWTVKLREKHSVDTMVLEEKTDAVTSFGIYGKEVDGSYSLLYKQNRIDEYRVCVFEEIETDELRIEVFANTGNVKINDVKVYNSQSAKRKTSFRVTDYLLTTNKKLKNNSNKAEFYGHLGVVDDLITYGDISMDDSGKIVFNEGEDDFAEDIQILNEMKVKAKNPDMKVVVNVNLKSHVKEEKDSKKNTAVSKWMKKNRSAIVSSITAFAEKYNIDGIDLDWDYPETAGQWSQYSKLIVDLSTSLTAKKKYVTVALLPWDCRLSKKARNAVEYVNLQAYNMFDERGEHASQYESCKLSVETFLKKSKFDAEKVMLGLPFFGRTTNKSSMVFDPSEYFKSKENIDKWINKIYNYRFVDGTMERYSDVYFNGYAMIADKTAFAIATGLGGVSIFGLQYDVPSNWELSLHNAVAQTIARRVETTPAA